MVYVMVCDVGASHTTRKLFYEMCFIIVDFVLCMLIEHSWTVTGGVYREILDVGHNHSRILKH